eukprot:TRINITY_DN18296_c0_g1_i1.p1 TRINITY_DN18296_c0_g1~~TRINITY_DN18296_c0_g1_i1.p1  ORF type:complete len:369 (-),score=37.60 TRINITY_DN18296_c0_g1_i1:327-1433(-)
MVVSHDESGRYSECSESSPLDFLPAELRYHIVFEFLTIKDIVAVSQISKKWRDFIWCQLPELRLSDSGYTPTKPLLRIRSAENLVFVAQECTGTGSQLLRRSSMGSRPPQEVRVRPAPAVDRFVSTVALQCSALRVLDVRSHRDLPLLGVGRYFPILYANESTVLNVALLVGLEWLETILCDFVVHSIDQHDPRCVDISEDDECDDLSVLPPAGLCGMPSVRRVEAVAHLGSRYKSVENDMTCHGLYGGRRNFRGFKPGRGAAWFIASFPQLEALQLAYPRVQWADLSPMAARFVPIEFKHQKFTTLNVSTHLFFKALDDATRANCLRGVDFEDCLVDPNGYVRRHNTLSKNGTWACVGDPNSESARF